MRTRKNLPLMIPMTIVVALLLLGAVLTNGMAYQGGPGPEFTDDFDLGHAQLVANGHNQYFSLQPGRILRLEGDDDGEFVEVEISVLDQIRFIPMEIDGVDTIVRTRVVREREWIDGELVEVSRNFFARDSKTGNIYYFGEDVDFYEDGVIVGHEGSWLAGVDGAQPGLIMPSLFLLGSRYFQEVAPGIALDQAKHVESGLTVDTPAGTFTDCVRVRETSPLDDPGSFSDKIYAPGVGLIVDDAIELVEAVGP